MLCDPRRRSRAANPHSAVALEAAPARLCTPIGTHNGGGASRASIIGDVIATVMGTNDGGRVLMVGLTPADLEQLQKHGPIRLEPEQTGQPGLRLLLNFGSSEEQLLAMLRALGVEVRRR